MSDHEKVNGTAVPEDDNIRPVEGLPEDDPEYVRDLLTRLKEEMAVIHKGEEKSPRLSDGEEDIDPAVLASADEAEDDDIPFDMGDTVLAQPATPSAVVKTPAAEAREQASGVRAYATVTPAWEELTMNALIDDMIAKKKAEAELPASQEKAVGRAEAVTESLLAELPTPPVIREEVVTDEEEIPENTDSAPLVENITVSEEPSAAEAVIEEEPTPIPEEIPAAEEASAVEEIPASVVEEAPTATIEEQPAPVVEEAPPPIVVRAADIAAEAIEAKASAPVAEPAHVADAPVSNAAAQKSSDYDGIWAVAAAANAQAKKRKVYRARLLRREGVFFGAAPKDTELNIPSAPVADAASDAVNTPYCEPAEAPESIEPIGTLRPQDFFIADLRDEGEVSLGKADEYVSRNQIEGILNAYAAEKKQVSLRFILAVILSSFLLIFENLPLLGVNYSALLGIGARAAVLVDVGLLLAVALLATDRLHEGACQLFAWEIGTSAITLISLTISLLLSTITLFLGIQTLLSLPAAIALTLSVFFYRMQLMDDERTFLLLCESGDKLAAESIPAFCATEEVAVLGRRIREVVRIKKVGFVTGYFARTKQKREDYRLHAMLTLVALLALDLTTVLCVLLTKDATMSLSLAAWLLAPLSLSVFYAARRLPFHHLVDTAEVHGTAVLGESSAEDYGRVDAIAFEDVEAFRSNDVFVHQIKLYENGQLDELLYDLAGVFSVLGGPLDAVFRVAAAELGMPSDVVLISTGHEGLEASVEGVRISLGKWAHFRTEMISPYYDSEDTYREDCGEFSIMYVAIEGVIRAKVYLKYTMNEHFEKNVRRLQRNGVRTLLRSYDPNIGDSLVAGASHSTNLRVKVVRKKPDQLHDFAESRVDSGLVTSAGSRDLLYTLFMCQNYRKAVRILRYCKALATPLSILTAILLPLMAGTPFASVYGAAIGLFWLIPVHFVSRFYFKKER